MVQSKAATVDEYLAELPAERRAVMTAVRDVVLKHLPKGYRESMAYGMITYCVPLERFPDTYNGQPLCYVSLAAQKNHYAVYLMCVYGDGKLRAKLEADFEKAGKKLDMGKSCVRFRKLKDLPLPAITSAVAAVTPEKYIAWYKKNRGEKK
jgi:Domain of unknown function (DU1801)